MKLKHMTSLFLCMMMITFLSACVKEPEKEEDTYYTVTFETNGGTSIVAQTVKSGDNSLRPVDPKRGNDVFDDWYETTNLTGTAFNFNTPIKADITLYAKWIVGSVFTTTYKVTFDYDNDSNPLIIEVEANGKLEKPVDPTKEGYTFESWYQDSAHTLVWDFEVNTVTADTTLYAKWEKVPVRTFTVTFNFDNDSSPLIIEINESGKVEKPVDPTKEGFLFINWFIEDLVFDFDTVITEDITLKAHWELDSTTSDVAYIDTKEALLELFAKGGDGKYELTADIDFDGVFVDGSGANFSGTLDGNGYTISNLHATGTANKQGALFKRVVGGTIKNIKFVNSSMTAGGNGEGTAFITYAAHGAATFDQLEFTNVKVIGKHSYTALIFADNADDTQTDAIKTLSRITVINNSDNPILGSTYTGGLIGHVRTTAKINLSYIYFSAKVSSSNPALNQVAGSLIGRIQGANSEITINQAVIKGSVEATKNVSAIIGTSVASKLTATNVFIEDFSASVSEGNKINTLIGNVNGMTLDATNVYFNQTTTVLQAIDTPQSPTQGMGLTPPEINLNWFDQSGLSSSYFKLDDGKVLLNRVSGPITEESISIIADSIQTTYHVGEALNLSSLIVKLNFSDASSDTLSRETYVIDDTEIDLNSVGTYYLHVSYKSYTAKIAIKVVEVTGFNTHTMDFNHVFLLNTTQIDLNGIALTANLSDGNIMVLSETDYQIDSSAIDLTIEGTYEITVTYRDFAAQKIKVFVSDRYIDDNLVINVNQVETQNLGILNEHTIVYPTIQAALNYLTRLNLDEHVKKVIAVADGTYKEKLTISIPNLTILGQSQTNTIITYDAASGTLNPAGAAWGTQGSATLSVKSQATGFALARITVENGFDYFNSSVNDKQAVAIVNEADKAIFTQVNIKGVQDTLYAKQGRQWYINNYIEGAVDYIFGNGGPAYFEQNTIHTIYRSNADGVITAQKGENNSGKPLAYGYVFYNNTLTTDNTTRPVLFGRPWGSIAKVMFIENEIGEGMTTGWTEMSGNKPENAFFYEYRNTTNGQILENTTHGKNMTDAAAAAAIDKTNVFAQINGADAFSDVWDYEAHFIYIGELLGGIR